MKYLKNYDQYNESLINEKMLSVSVEDDIIGYIKDDDIEIKNKLSRVVGSSSVKKDLISFLISNVNIPKQQAELMFDVLSKSDDISKIKNYFLNRNINIDSLIGNITEASSINSKLGLIGNTSQEFFNFSWRTSPPMGPGEVYLSTILKDGRRPTTKEKGDCMIGNSEMEIKGPGARLIGQSGYGDAKKMRESLFTAIKNIAFQLNIEHTVINDKSDNFWNITTRDGRGFEKNLIEISKSYGKFGKKELLIISAELVNAWGTYLLNLDTRENSGIFIDCISSDGKINIKKYNRNLLSMFFNYYYSLENFHYFCMTHESGKFLIINPKDFMKFYDNGIIKIKAPPSFTNQAGTQGGSFAIIL